MDEWWLPVLAREIPMPEMTVKNWIDRGWIKARRHVARWIIWADKKEIERLRELRRRPFWWLPDRRSDISGGTN